MGSPNLICVVLRGGMDGLSAISRPSDPELSKSRPSIMVEQSLPLTQGFACHPVLKNIHKMFVEGDLSFMHACGPPFRDRSHFKSQDILESGLEQAHPVDGWLGRAMTLAPGKLEGVAFGPTVPLLLKGAQASLNWTNPKLNARDDQALNIMQTRLYADDPELMIAMRQFERLKTLLATGPVKDRSQDPFEVIGGLVARPQGPDIGVISLGGWDTHDDQNRRIRKEFMKLDAGLGTLRKVLKEVWSETVIIIASEFGRSVRQNGTLGTDHGTGGVVFMAGGAVKGGQSLGIWPGLNPDQLYAGRDLLPVNDIRDIFAHVLTHHFGLSHATITEKIFPGLSENYVSLPLLRSEGTA